MRKFEKVQNIESVKLPERSTKNSARIRFQ